MNALPIIVGLFAAAGVWLIIAGIRGAGVGDPATLARQRLARQEIGLGQSAVALELEKSLGERLLAPLRRWFARQMIRMTPATQAATFRRNLDFVGAPLGLDPAGLQTLRIAGAAALGTVGVALGVLIGSPLALGLALLGGAAIGFYMPVLWLDQLVRQRRAELESALPNALDVVAISMEAGLGLDRALEQLVRPPGGPAHAAGGASAAGDRARPPTRGSAGGDGAGDGDRGLRRTGALDPPRGAHRRSHRAHHCCAFGADASQAPPTHPG